MSPGTTKRMTTCWPSGVNFITLRRPVRSTENAFAVSPCSKTAAPLGIRSAVARLMTSSSSTSSMALNTGKDWMRLRSSGGMGPPRTSPRDVGRVGESPLDEGEAWIGRPPELGHQRDPLLVGSLLRIAPHSQSRESPKPKPFRGRALAQAGNQSQVAKAEDRLGSGGFIAQASQQIAN